MKTDDLISAMIEDRGAPRFMLHARMAVALGTSGAATAALFALGLGVRPDVGSALETWRFLFKLAVTLVLFALALWACMQLTRPDARIQKVGAALAAVPILLAAAVGYELTAVPAEAWSERAVGSNSSVCLAAIPVLALVPLAASLIALRAGAPRSPSLAGAAAGLLAGALAAVFYAVHCTDDSPLFIALWYPLAIVAVSLAGAFAGARLLRW